jgi:hypothetical protein
MSDEWKIDFDIEGAIKESDRLNFIIWAQKYRISTLENYLIFKGLKQEFDEWTTN